MRHKKTLGWRRPVQSYASTQQGLNDIDLQIDNGMANYEV